MAPKDRLIFALDLPDRSSAEKYVRLLKGRVGLFKVGLELFVSEGPEIVRQIHEISGVPLFLDLKLHDIPATVRRTIAVIRERHGDTVRFLTVHGEMGVESLKTAAEASQGKPGLLAVTLLTSVGKEALQRGPYRKEFSDDPGLLVESRARSAFEAGCAGVICSGQEAARIRKVTAPGFLIVTPGIRPDWAAGSDDQARAMTPAEAIRNGADYFVVGRPIRDAKDPVEAAEKIVAELDQAILDSST